VISLSTGEPDFPTPTHVIEAAIGAMRRGDTRYPPTAGTLALREALAQRAEGPGCAVDDVIVANGAKQVLSNAFMATLNDSDEVIVPTPYWTSYADMIAVAGGRLVPVSCGARQGFKLTPKQLSAAITPHTRWLLLNSPSNPSGAMYRAQELAALAEVLRRQPQVWIASDEIYQHIAYAPFASFRAVAPDLADRTLLVNGVSKAYAMTGWRIGWGIGPKALIKSMIAIQGQSTSGACSISQAAALAAITGPQDLLHERAAAFRARRDLVVSRLKSAEHLDCPTPDGAFYVFPSCSSALGRRTPDGTILRSDADFCRYLLEAEGLAAVPGRAFSAPGHFRLSYAYSESELTEGCERIVRACATLD
jgi:aspartate aminotransferase